MEAGAWLSFQSHRKGRWASRRLLYSTPVPSSSRSDRQNHMLIGSRSQQTTATPLQQISVWTSSWCIDLMHRKGHWLRILLPLRYLSEVQDPVTLHFIRTAGSLT